MNNEPFDRTQFVISYELLQLIEWLIEHEQENLKKLIKRSVENGLKTKSHTISNKHNEDLQNTIIELFGLLDGLLHEVIHEDADQIALERSLVPAIKQIDTASHDSSSIAISMAKATAAAEQRSTAGPSAKEILCKELLKRWKPTKKNSH